jgi:hypothetical protein
MTTCEDGCADFVWEKSPGRTVELLDMTMVLREDRAVLTCADCGQMFFREGEVEEMVRYVDQVRANEREEFANKLVDVNIVTVMVMAAVQDAFADNMKREDFLELVRDVWKSRESFEAAVIASKAVGGVQ